MQYTLRGLTKSTITFSKINLIIRGDVGDESICRNVEISEEQLKEINELVNAGFIEATINEVNVAYVEVEPVIPETNFISHKTVIPKAEEKSKVPHITIDMNNRDIENKTPKEIAEEIAEEVMTEYKKQTKTSKSKKIKRSLVTESEDGKPIVISTDGAKVAKIHKTAESDLEDSPQVSESLKAAEKLDNPEADEDKVVEQVIAEQDKMGSDAVIVVGNNNFQKKAMKRSIVNETDEIDNCDPFIDNDKDLKMKEDEKLKSVFIEPIEEIEEESDAFIEV